MSKTVAIVGDLIKKLPKRVCRECSIPLKEDWRPSKCSDCLDEYV